MNPSSIYSWFLKPLTLLHSGFLTKKSWVVAYFSNFFQLFVDKKSFFIKVLLCNFSMRLLKHFLKIFKKIFCLATKKLKKPPQKVAYLSRNSVVSEIFFLLSYICPTAQMAEFMFQNVAYRATVYRTGINMLIVYRISSYSFLPWIVSSPWIVSLSSEETIQVFIT